MIQSQTTGLNDVSEFGLPLLIFSDLVIKTYLMAPVARWSTREKGI